MQQIALIPMKELSLAKARLSPVLDEGTRGRLALALFQDVLARTLECKALASVTIVSTDEQVLTEAKTAGADTFSEPGNLNEALTLAAKAAKKQGARRVIVIAADLPLVHAEDIETVANTKGDLVIVQSGDGGTNVLAIRPGTIEFQFGPNSARRHLSSAGKANLRTVELDLPRIALDIDTPDDLVKLRVTAENGDAVGAHTLKALERIGIVRAALRGG